MTTVQFSNSDPADLAEARRQRAEAKCAERNSRVLEAAIVEACEQGYQFITREAVAARAGVSAGGVNNAFGTMLELKRAVLRTAIERRILRIVADGIAMASPVVADLPPELRREALATLAD